MNCPFCASDRIIFKAKAGKWECESCEERFEGAAPEMPASAYSSAIGAKAPNPKKIFFSYGHDANRDLVDRFKADLEKRGHEVWIDYKEIGTWDDWRGTITRGIHDSQMAVAFLSIHSTRDPGVCRNEIAMALHHFGTVYPVMVEAVPRESIPTTITHLQWPDLSQWRELKANTDPQAFERFYEEKLLEIINRVEGEATRFAMESDVLRRVLEPSDFDSKFAQHLEGFIGRDWCFEAFESWLNHQPGSRVFWVKAGPGFGKTALAVHIASRFRGAVVGTWFCDYQSRELSDPLQAVRTLAFQLALRWDDYRSRLLPRLGLFAGSGDEQIREAKETLAKKNLKDLFETLLAGPMAGLIWREHKLVILVDALDEVSREAEGRNDLAGLISNEFLDLPEWISFVVTSRPDALVSGHLQRFRPFEIAAEDARNEADMGSFVRQRIMARHEMQGLLENERQRLSELLLSKSGGMVLYLRMVEEGLNEGTLEAVQLENMDSGLAGLHSRYYQSFERRFRAVGYTSAAQPLLRLLLAVPGPLPLDLAAEILEIGREEVHRMRALLGTYVFETPKGMTLFHKTLGEWLASDRAGIFQTDDRPAAKRLAECLWKCFEGRRKNQLGRSGPLKWEEQVIDWLPGLLGLISKDKDSASLLALADLHDERVRYQGAEALCRCALAVCEKTLGADHADTLSSVNSLAVLLNNKGDYNESETMQRRALAGREQVLGLEHPDTLSSASNLGTLLREKGSYDEAWILLKRALAGREKALGSEHPDTLSSADDLGALFRAKGNYDDAEALYRRALTGREKALGAEHPDTLSSANNLGILLRDKGDYSGAEVLHRRALTGREKALGAEHPDTLSSADDLGVLLCIKNEYDEAETMQRRALLGRERVLGNDHPATICAANNLGILLSEKGDLSGAEAAYRRALAGYEMALGLEHPTTLCVINNLGTLLCQQGRYQESEDLHRRAFAARERLLGNEHPLTACSALNLGIVVRAMGDFRQAENLLRLAVAGNEKTLGKDHRDTVLAINNLALLFNLSGQLQEALLLLREHAVVSPVAYDGVRYNLACYECLSGNTEEAKRLVAEHIKAHPEMKDLALSDPDFETIKDFIATL